MRTLEFDAQQNAVVLIDQTRLPHETVLVACRSPEDVAHAIRSMQIRGAPAIGVAAAYGLVLCAAAYPADDSGGFVTDLERAASLLRQTRPTAVNLGWAIDRTLARGREVAERAGVTAARTALLRLAHTMAAEDVAANKRMGAFGLDLVPSGANVLTHCNAGALATV